MKIFYQIIIYLIVSFNLNSQNLNYSQFYSSPLNLNPAMTGIGEFGRVGVNYRNQWPSYVGGIHYFSSWVDYNLMKSNFSLGLNISNEFEEVYKLSTSHLSTSFSYEINLNYNWVLRSGAQFSIVDSRLKNDLIFLDQFNPDGTIGTSAENLMVYGNRNYLSLAMGILAYSEKIWIGGSIYNLNEPNVSFTNEKINLDRLYSFHIGFTIDKFKMSPSLHFKKQSKFNQLDIGTYFNLEPINFGIWYRGIPIDSNNNFNSLISSLGINLKDLMISYSYDYNFSELSDSGGSHEISIIYNFNFLGKKIPPKNARFLQCPIPNF